MSVCLSVPNNRQITAEPIGANFFVAFHITPGGRFIDDES